MTGDRSACLWCYGIRKNADAPPAQKFHGAKIDVVTPLAGSGKTVLAYVLYPIFSERCGRLIGIDIARVL